MMIKLDIYSTNVEEIEIAERYWGVDSEGNFAEKVNALLPFRGIKNSSQLAAFIREIAQASDTRQVCPECSGALIISSRSEFQKSVQKLRYPCNQCQQSSKKAQREIEEKAEINLQLRLEAIRKYNLSRTIDYQALPDDIALLLLALERSISPRLLGGVFTRNDCGSLAPGNVGDFLRKLYKESVILDDPSKAKRGVYHLRDDEIWHHADQVTYFLTPDTTLGVDEDALSLLDSRPYDDHKSIRNLWLDYAVSDCMCYFFDQCQLYSLVTTEEADAEICSTLRNALHTYCVAQMWSVIWKVVRDAASLSARSYYNRSTAAATISGKIRRHLERANKEMIDIHQWDRPTHLPAGTLGQIFIEKFSIDEYTFGFDVMSIFADQESTVLVDMDSSASELTESVENLLTGALENRIAAEVMLFFADAIRGGSNVATAIDEIIEAFPMLKETVNSLQSPRNFEGGLQ
ncbi:MAG: hypothetical protein K2Y13_06785 [Burkholderiaceae bacterium]|nr:hypothetical protein [Burkholderiaceae bacterium]